MLKMMPSLKKFCQATDKICQDLLCDLTAKCSHLTSKSGMGFVLIKTKGGERR